MIANGDNCLLNLVDPSDSILSVVGILLFSDKCHIQMNLDNVTDLVVKQNKMKVQYFIGSISVFFPYFILSVNWIQLIT